MALPVQKVPMEEQTDRGLGSAEVYSAAHSGWSGHPGVAVNPSDSLEMREGEGRTQNNRRISGLGVWWMRFPDSKERNVDTWG